MSGDLRGLVALNAIALHVLADLLAAWTGGVKVLLRVALDFGSAAFAWFNFITKIAQPVHQLRLINRSGILLRREETLRLERPRRAIGALGDIEDDGVGMKLRRGITIHRTGGVVLELGGHELLCSFGRMIAADPRLRVPLQFIQGSRDCGAMRFPNTFIAANQRRQRYGFRR